MTRLRPIWYFQKSDRGVMWTNVKKTITIQLKVTFCERHHDVCWEISIKSIILSFIKHLLSLLSSEPFTFLASAICKYASHHLISMKFFSFLSHPPFISHFKQMVLSIFFGLHTQKNIISSLKIYFTKKKNARKRNWRRIHLLLRPNDVCRMCIVSPKMHTQEGNNTKKCQIIRDA